MKKIILTGTILCFFFAAFSQRKAEFGLKAGVNMTTLKDDASNSVDGRAGWHAGALAHIHINKHFALQPEIMYSAQGAEYPGYKQKFNYINIPVLGQYMFGQGFRVQTGPQFGILASAKTKSGDTEIDIKDEVNTFDFSWSLGTGYLSSTGLGVDLRYNFGITNVRESGPDLKNRVWQIGVFYQFRH